MRGRAAREAALFFCENFVKNYENFEKPLTLNF